MCIRFRCHGCGHIAYHRCFHARGPQNRHVDPRLCRFVEPGDNEERRRCQQCMTVEEALDRLEVWVKTEGGAQLPTAGSSAASSPGAGSSRRDQRRHPSVAHPELQQTGANQVQPGPAGTFGRPAANEDVADWQMADDNEVVTIAPRPRPLSGSTIASSSTAPTAIGSSASHSKSNSESNPQGLPPVQESHEASSQPRFESNLPYGPPEVQSLSGLINRGRGQSVPSTPAGSPAHSSNEATPRRPRTRAPMEGQEAPPYPPNDAIPSSSTTATTTNQPAEAGADTSDPFETGTGGLKRTISTLSFDDLTDNTRTACPPSEATDVPPAYARPRSEVGLPPLVPGTTDEDGDVQMEGADEDDTEGASEQLAAGEGSFEWRRVRRS